MRDCSGGPAHGWQSGFTSAWGGDRLDVGPWPWGRATLKEIVSILVGAFAGLTAFAVLLLVSVPKNLAFYARSCLARLIGPHWPKTDADLEVQEHCIAAGCR